MENAPSAQNDRAEIRKLEPYCYGQFTEGKDSPHFGRSHVHWLTGTASTVMVGCVEGILGMRPDFGGLRIAPSIPADWDQFTIGPPTSPIEAGLGWITKFAEGKNFINRPMLEKQKTEGTVRKLVGFEMVDRGIPRHGYELFNTEGEAIGVVTSGTMSPTRKIGIGMGYVKPEYSKQYVTEPVDVT